MKTLYSSVFVATLLWVGVVHGEDAGAIVARQLQREVNPKSEQFAQLVREVATIIGADQGIKAHIEAEQSRYPVHDALFLGAARNVSFNQEAFADKYPALFGYGHVLLVSDRVFDSPRVIYQLLGPTGYRPRMVAENKASIAAAEYVNVGKWNDPEHLAEWIGEWTFEDTPEGPYLLSTVIGRETTGATTLRHVLGWVRIEPNRLVPERFEAYDVPLGQRRDAAHLKVTATPEKPVERVPDGRGARLPDLKNTQPPDQSHVSSSESAPSPSSKLIDQVSQSQSHSMAIWISLLVIGTGIVFAVYLARTKDRRKHD